VSSLLSVDKIMYEVVKALLTLVDATVPILYCFNGQARGID
jgi:hypothetical protein